MIISKKKFANQVLLYMVVFSLIYQSGSVPAALGVHTLLNMLTKIIMLVIPLCYFVWIFDKKIQKNEVILMVFIFIGILFSFFQYEDSIFKLIYKVITFYLFFYMCDYAHKKNLNIEKVIYNVILIVDIIAIALYITLELFHIGIPFHYAHIEGSYWYRNYFELFFTCSYGQLLPRLSGMFWEPGVYAIFLNLQLYFYFSDEKNKRNNYQLGLILLCLLLTQSAAGYCVMLLILYQQLSKWKKISRYSRRICALFSLFIILIIGAFVLNYKKNLDANDLINYSYGIRIADLYNGLRIFVSHPLFGVGYGRTDLFIANTVTGRGSSNGLVSWMYMMGIYGTVIVLYPFIKNIKKYKKNDQALWFIIVLLFNICEPIYVLPLMQYILSAEYHKMFYHSFFHEYNNMLKIKR